MPRSSAVAACQGAVSKRSKRGQACTFIGTGTTVRVVACYQNNLPTEVHFWRSEVGLCMCPVPTHPSCHAPGLERMSTAASLAHVSDDLHAVLFGARRSVWRLSLRHANRHQACHLAWHLSMEVSLGHNQKPLGETDDLARNLTRSTKHLRAIDAFAVAVGVVRAVSSATKHREKPSQPAPQLFSFEF